MSSISSEEGQGVGGGGSNTRKASGEGNAWHSWVWQLQREPFAGCDGRGA